jgi:flavin-dependent dehydrogenase
VILARLGVWDRFRAAEHTPSNGILSAWGSSDLYDNDFIFNAYGTGWHIDRTRFDAMLASAAEAAGAQIWRGVRIRAVLRRGRGWLILIDDATVPREAEAQMLVDATGRAGWIAHSQGSRRRAYDHLIGLIGVLSLEASAPPTVPVLLLEAAEEGWWYSAPLPDRTLIVAYMTDADYLTASGVRRTDFWKHKLNHTIHTVSRTRGFRLPAEVHVRSASSSRLEQIVGPGWVAVGDAASVYDPLSAAGIGKALHSGLHAASAIHAHLSGHHGGLDEYATSIGEQFEMYLKQRQYYYRKEARWPQSLFWQRRQALPECSPAG